MKSPKESSKPQVVWTWVNSHGFLLLYILCCTAFALTLHFYLDGKPFRIGSRPLGALNIPNPLYQTDVSFLLAGAATLRRING